MTKLDELKGDLDFIKSVKSWIYNFIFADTTATVWLFVNNTNSEFIFWGIAIDFLLFIGLFVAIVFYFEKNREIGETKDE